MQEPGGRAAADAARDAELATFEQLGDDVGDDEYGLELDGAEERTEDAMIDTPMANVHVSNERQLPSEPAFGAEVDDGLDGWGVRKLKEYIQVRALSARRSDRTMRACARLQHDT